MTDELLTFEQARERTRQARIDAIAAAFDADPPEVAQRRARIAVAAYESVEPTLPSDCPHVDPEWGQCEREYGHEPFIIRAELRNVGDDPDGAPEPYNGMPDNVTPDGRRMRWVGVEDASSEGHHSYEAMDPRRPEGSHPWDY